jgi:glyoxylate carboligase
MIMSETSAADLIVKCLENEGVEFVFGIPGEENIRLIDALDGSRIRFVLARSEQGASFMADMYGRVTGRAGVCTATLGPGAINLLLGVADAHCDSTPLVAITAQVGMNRIYKETHQFVDLQAMFRPITKWAETAYTADALPEMIRAAFKSAQTERPGAAYLAVPQDVEAATVDAAQVPLPADRVRPEAPSPAQIARGRSDKRLSATRFAGRPWRRPCRRPSRDCPILGEAQHPGGNHLPRQGCDAERSPQCVGGDRLHGARLYELRLRRCGSDREHRLRAAGDAARPAQSAAR